VVWKPPFNRALRDCLLVALWALSLRILFALLTSNTYDPDEFVILVLSRDWTSKVVPYRDFMFFHPPGMLLLFRALGPLTTWWWPSARVFVLLVDTATAVMVWKLGTLLYGRRTAVAAGLLYGASPLALICAVRIEQDPIITALGVGGLLLLLTTRTHAGSVLAGVCLGLAVCVKYPAALFLPVYVLAAPRRSLLAGLAAAAVALVAVIPFVPELHAFFQQTVTWQVVRRAPLDFMHRLGPVAVFWLLLNPLAVIAVVKGRKPLWLLSGFAVGGVFLFASQAYYHYFVPVLPFAALLAAPMVAGFIRKGPRTAAGVAIALVVGWALDINSGTGPLSLFITASHLSSVQTTARALDRWTSPHTPILTDQFEYAFLARRKPVSDYFWNMSGVVPARVLEDRLPSGGAVVVTERVAPTYPSGFTSFLAGKRYVHLQSGNTQIWLLVPNRLTADSDVSNAMLCTAHVRHPVSPILLSAGQCP
jgi:4-amino-4-deoxy-L-arabinose transferase-like glycosyltransferase